MSWDTNHYKDRSDGHSSNPERILESGSARLGISLSAHMLAQFERYQYELLEWNARVNLTSITEPEDIQRRHFLDSLSCIAGAPHHFSQAGCTIIDIGSGAGFPGIPLKLALPHVQLALVETRGKRAAFLQHVIDVLEIDRTVVIRERAETLGQDPIHRERYDVALARALG